MSTRAGTVPLSDLQFLKIYFNRKRLPSTPANLRKMLAETGGDAICNGSIFLRDQTPACHLKAGGKAIVCVSGGGKQLFSNGGHYIYIGGLDKSGNMIVLAPYW